MINRININDLDRFNELGCLINNNFINVYLLNDLLKSEIDYIFGYYEKDLLIGFIHVSKLYENLDIVNIVVDIDYRNKGIANKMVNFVLKYFKDVEKVMLEVNENNVSAISLYKKNNFEIRSYRYDGKLARPIRIKESKIAIFVFQILRAIVPYLFLVISLSFIHLYSFYYDIYVDKSV